MKDSLVVSYKTKHILAILASITFLDYIHYIPKWTENVYPYTVHLWEFGVYENTLLSALFSCGPKMSLKNKVY